MLVARVLQFSKSFSLSAGYIVSLSLRLMFWASNETERYIALSCVLCFLSVFGTFILQVGKIFDLATSHPKLGQTNDN